MGTWQKLSSFGAALLLTVGAAFAVGAAFGPGEEVADSAGHAGEDAPHAEAPHAEAPHPEAPHANAGGHGSAGHSAGGELRLDLLTPALPRGAGEIAFRVRDAAGRTVEHGYEIESERRLHLIVVRDDTAVYRHLHPRLGGDGAWRVPADLGRPGSYRLIADFTLAGERHAETAELTVPGRVGPPVPLEPPAEVVEASGYQVELHHPHAVAGGSSELRFTVARDGRAVRGIQPYLGSAGHLVALRQGDLEYLHVHPEEEAGGQGLTFGAHFPTAGRYRLFLEFRHGDRVVTAPFTVDVTGEEPHS